MRELVQKLEFKHRRNEFQEAKKFFEEKKQPFKVELISDIEKHGTTVFKDITGDSGSDKEKPTPMFLFTTQENSLIYVVVDI